MVKNSIYLKRPTIDSLRLSYPLNLVNITDEAILTKVVCSQSTRTDTGEVIEESFKESNSQLIYFDEEQTYSIKVRIEEWFGKEKYLCILLNSKINENQYLQGITLNNIEKIYKKLNGIIFDMTFKQFMSGKPTDIDIKKDVEVDSIEYFTEATLEFERSTKQHKKKGIGVNRFNQRMNKGIEWNERSKSTAEHPFLKVYHKGTEAKFGKNRDFFYKYLHNIDLDKIARIEATLKNSKQCKKLNIDNTSLLTLLNTTEEELNSVIIDSIDRNLLDRKPLKKQCTKKELSGQNMLMFIHLSNMISNQNYTFEEALEWTLSQYIDTNDRYRQKKKLIAIYEEFIKGETYELRTRKLNKFFNDIGWG